STAGCTSCAGTRSRATLTTTARRREVHVKPGCRFGEMLHHHHADARTLQEVDHVHQPRGFATIAAAGVGHLRHATTASELLEECCLLVIEAFVDLRQVVRRNRQGSEDGALSLEHIHKLWSVRIDLWTIQSNDTDLDLLQIVTCRVPVEWNVGDT